MNRSHAGFARNLARGCFTSHLVHPRLALGDGTIHVRPARRDDREAMQTFVGQLSPVSRAGRFFAPIAQLSDWHLDCFTRFDFPQAASLVAYEPTSPGNRIVGHAQYVRLDDEDAELAIVVHDHWQGCGLGCRLGSLAIDLARLAGARRMIAETLEWNQAMLAVGARLGFRRVPSGDPRVGRLVKPLAAPRARMPA